MTEVIVDPKYIRIRAEDLSEPRWRWPQELARAFAGQAKPQLRFVVCCMRARTAFIFCAGRAITHTDLLVQHYERDRVDDTTCVGGGFVLPAVIIAEDSEQPSLVLGGSSEQYHAVPPAFLQEITAPLERLLREQGVLGNSNVTVCPDQRGWQLNAYWAGQEAEDILASLRQGA